MSAPNGKRLLFVATAAIVLAFVIAACAIQLRGDDDSAQPASPVTQSRNTIAAELERCREVITSEQAAELHECRRVWAENRRRFLGKRKSSAASSVDAQSNTPALSSRQHKDPERVLGDRPSVATPKSE